MLSIEQYGHIAFGVVIVIFVVVLGGLASALTYKKK